jgi:hypothetical protein
MQEIFAILLSWLEKWINYHIIGANGKNNLTYFVAEIAYKLNLKYKNCIILIETIQFYYQENEIELLKKT